MKCGFLKYDREAVQMLAECGYSVDPDGDVTCEGIIFTCFERTTIGHAVVRGDLTCALMHFDVAAYTIARQQIVKERPMRLVAARDVMMGVDIHWRVLLATQECNDPLMLSLAEKIAQKGFLI